MRKIGLILCVMLSFSKMWGQKIFGEIPFDVKGYELAKVGYPSKMIPDGKGNFIFAEFWVSGNEGRRYTMHFAQCYDENLEEKWNRPAFNPLMNVDFTDIFRLDKSFVTVGTSYDAKSKKLAANAQFFRLDGKEIGNTVEISNYAKSAPKGAENMYYVSPDSGKLGWFGYVPGDSYKSKYHFTVYSSSGQLLWSEKEMPLPYSEQKYIVKQAGVDKKGNAIFLLTYYAPNSTADTVYKPYLVRYDYLQKKYSEVELKYYNGTACNVQFFINSDNKIYVFGNTTMDKSGIPNGMEINGKEEFWDKILVAEIDNNTQQLSTVRNAMFKLPDSFLQKYKSGSNFSKFEFYSVEGKLYWLMEESFTKKVDGKNIVNFNNIDIFQFDIAGFNLGWHTTIEKKQRNYESGSFLSYFSTLYKGKLIFIYLSEMGSGGKVISNALDLTNGKATPYEIVFNNNGMYHIFAKKSCIFSDKFGVLIGPGDMSKANYKLIRLDFTK